MLFRRQYTFCVGLLRYQRLSPTTHSARVGMARDLTSRGASLVQIQLAGYWRSPEVPARYARGESADEGLWRGCSRTASRPSRAEFRRAALRPSEPSR